PTSARTSLSTYTQTPDIYPLSLHDALPIYQLHIRRAESQREIRWKRRCDAKPFRHVDNRVDAHFFRELYGGNVARAGQRAAKSEDRKSTRLNSSHVSTSYAVFCLKKKKQPR